MSDAPPTNEPSIDDVNERLRVAHPAATRLAFEEARRQLEFAHKVRDKLEGKAQGMLSASGVTLSLTLVASKVLAETSASGFGSWWPLPLVLAMVLLASALLAMKALRTADDNVQTKFENVFHTHALEGETEWLKFMTPHMVDVGREQEGYNEDRAKWVKRSQWAYSAFLVVLVLGILFGGAVTAYQRYCGNANMAADGNDQDIRTEEKL